jgi:WD40 repeat protein
MKRLASLSILLLAGSVFSASALAQTGVINLGPEEILQAKGQEIVVPGYSVPSFEDWNNDKLADLIVGEGGGGATGKIRVYLNVGTAADPCFTDYFYAQSYGKDIVCSAEGCLGCFPRLVYWDDDKQKDLLVGYGDGTIRVFLNVGTANEPSFTGDSYVKVGTEDINTMDVGSRATPSLLDWNNDGMMDIVSGALDGGIHVYYNCGCGGPIPPHFYTSPTDGIFVQANGRDLLVSSARSSPAIVDADGDGKKDILTGNTDGQILFYNNVGTDSLPIFAGYTMVQSNGQPIDLPGNVRSRPAICHWTGEKDGYWDLLVGYGDGKIRLYRGIPKTGDFNGNGALDGDDFTVLAAALNQPVPAEGSPADLNKDGVVDILDLSLFADLWLAEHGAEKK